MTVPYLTTSPWTFLFSVSFCFCSRLDACYNKTRRVKKENFLKITNGNVWGEGLYHKWPSRLSFSLNHTWKPWGENTDAKCVQTRIFPRWWSDVRVQKCGAHLQLLKQNDVANLVLLVLCLLGLPELFLSRVATHGTNLEQAVWGETRSQGWRTGLTWSHQSCTSTCQTWCTDIRWYIETGSADYRLCT